MKQQAGTSIHLQRLHCLHNDIMSLPRRIWKDFGKPERSALVPATRGQPVEKLSTSSQQVEAWNIESYSYRCNSVSIHHPLPLFFELSCKLDQPHKAA